VDTHSHLGLYPRPRVPAHADGNEASAPLQSAVRALDAIWPDDPGIRMARAGGVTTANIMPGSGNAVGGQTAYVKLRGTTAEEMLIDGALGGIKMANGENPKRVYGRRNETPGTRMAVAALQRELFVDAQAYRDQRELGSDEPLARDLSLEPIVEVLEGRRTVHYHTHRADDIMSALRLREEFDFDLVLQHATEAFVVAERIAAARVPVSIIVVDSPGGKHEAIRLRFSNGQELERAGVRVAIHTDDPITSSRLFLRSAALAVRGGLSPEAALRAVTLEAARILHLDQRLGSLEVGKDADLVVLSGEPFSVYTKVLETWIEGERVFDRSDPDDRIYATGGFASGRRLEPLQ
jgi:imidazolonepropionase-like amidohydrolase